MRIDIQTADGRTRLESVHSPNTPRERDGQGNKVDEPVQCRRCFQAYPCDVKILLTQIRTGVAR